MLSPLRLRAVRLLSHHRRYTTEPPRSRHAQWYSDILPSMIPIFLLGSAVYLGLQLTQLKLAHEKYMDESAKRIQDLEDEVATLRQEHLTQPATPSGPMKKRSWW